MMLRRIKSWKIVFGLVLISFIALIIGYAILTNENNDPVQTTNTNSQSQTSNQPRVAPVAVTYETLDSEIEKNAIIKELPDDAEILLKFYNFNSGEREWEKSFVINKGEVYEGEAQSDITIVIHSKYLANMRSSNFCNVIKQAKNNGDLGIETEMSDAKLAWKYKGIMKYKDCFGL